MKAPKNISYHHILPLALTLIAIIATALYFMLAPSTTAHKFDREAWSRI